MRSLRLAAALAACTLAVAADDAPGRLALSTERLVVFKDGHCLVVRKGTATAGPDGRVYTDEVPDAAVLGSFWATPTRGRIVAMRASWVEAEEVTEVELPCTDTIDVVHANLGAAATVVTADKEVISGRIASVLARTIESPLGDELARALGLGAAREGHTRAIAALSGDRFVLRTDEGDVLLHAGAIRTLRIADMKTTAKRRVTTRHRTKRLVFATEDAGAQRELYLMYFRPGVRWIPTYRVELEPGAEPRANVSLQAELLNEAEDVRDAQVSLVVGVPHFRFKDAPSPLVLESAIRNSLAQAVPALGGNRQMLSNALYTQRAGEFRREAIEAGSQPADTGAELPPELTGGATQDLYVYSLGALTLLKGERAAVPIFTARVPYRDVYTWEVSLRRGDGDTPGGNEPSPLALETNRVWHQVALQNTTAMPWTTGAAMLMQGGQPLGQELLTYTSPKDEVRVPVTVAIDVRGTYDESETARQTQALNWGGYHYAKITKVGKLAVCNHKPHPIRLEIRCELGGRAESASDEGAVTLSEFRPEDWTRYQGHPSVNAHSTVRWTVELKPGEVVERTVRYHYFVRH